MKALIVDGYNAIHRIPYLKRIMDRSLREARSEITRLAKEYQRRCGGIDKVYIVFDGRDSYRDEAFAPPAHQVFSKTGEGDTEVIRLVSRLSGQYHVEVITDDNFIRNNARAHKAAVVEVSKFVKALDKKRKKNTKKDGADKIIPRTASRIDEELRGRWGV